MVLPSMDLPTIWTEAWGGPSVWPRRRAIIRAGRGTSALSSPARRNDVPLVTDAQPSADADLRSRRRRYTVLMLVHLVGLAVGGLLYRDAWTLGLIILIVTGPLQWVAVILANDSRRPRRTAPGARRSSAPTPRRELADPKEHRQTTEISP